MAYFDDIEILHGDVTSHCVAVLNQSFPGMYSVEFIRSGRMFFGIDGRPVTELNSPAVFWHHPSHSYQYGALDANGWEHRYITMRGPMARRLVEDGFMPLSAAGFFGVRNPEPVDSIFRGIISMVKSKATRLHGDIFVELERLLCFLRTEAVGRMADGTPHASAVLALAERMTGSPGSEFDIDDEARKVGLSYSHFRRLFAQITGQAPHDYLLSRRIVAAADALRTGRKSAKEVAHQLGFADPIHFCKAFKKRMGLSPGEYRRTTSQIMKH
jgi:AraC-like DNA-binding protein